MFAALSSWDTAVFAAISREHLPLEAEMLGVKHRAAPASVQMSQKQLGGQTGRSEGPMPGATAPADVSGSSRHLTPPRTGLWERLPEGNGLENRSCAVKCSIDAKRAVCLAKCIFLSAVSPSCELIHSWLSLPTVLSVMVLAQSWVQGDCRAGTKQQMFSRFSFLTEFPNSQPT